MKQSYLFSSTDWFSVRDNESEKFRREISQLDPERILNTPTYDLANFFAQKYELEIPILHRDNACVDQTEVQIDVSNDRSRYWSTSGPHYATGTSVICIIPFVGEAELFRVQPSSFSTMPPSGEVTGQTLKITIQGTNLIPQKVKDEIERQLTQIEVYLGNLRRDVAPHNAGLQATAQQILEARRTKPLADRSLVANLGFPIKQRPGLPNSLPAPEIRRKIRPSLPPQSKTAFQPEPTILDADYEHIIGVLENMNLLMERSPSAFRGLNEEDLRTHFLFHLNGHFEGQATGETFNFGGKTDILVRSNGKNVFIGECKFWHGPKKLHDTIDQLLSYACWRDAKIALLIFNRRKNFTDVLQSIPQTIRQHPNFKREIGEPSETRFRYTMAHNDDPARELVMTVLAFDVPVEQAAEK